MSSPTTKRPIVLIVEDETLIRMDAVEMVVAAGYEVLEAANADQAIEILEARGQTSPSSLLTFKCPVQSTGSN